MAVNMLSKSTLEQLDAVDKLSSNQQEIQTLAEKSLDTMTHQQNILLQHQMEITSSHAGLQNRIAENLQHLTEEKALIHSGQEQLANMTSDIKRQLGEAQRDTEPELCTASFPPCRTGIRHVGPAGAES